MLLSVLQTKRSRQSCVCAVFVWRCGRRCDRGEFGAVYVVFTIDRPLEADCALPLSVCPYAPGITKLCECCTVYFTPLFESRVGRDRQQCFFFFLSLCRFEHGTSLYVYYTNARCAAWSASRTVSYQTTSGVWVQASSSADS